MSEYIERVETTTVGEAARGERSFIQVPVREVVATLWDRIVENVTLAILSLPNGGGKSYNEARAIGEHVARLTLGEERPVTDIGDKTGDIPDTEHE